MHKDIIEKDIDFLLGSFKTFFGKLSPRKVIDIYEYLMAENNFEPVLSFKLSGGYINCREVSKEWKRIFG